jgi:hypothetical protein
MPILAVEAHDAVSLVAGSSSVLAHRLHWSEPMLQGPLPTSERYTKRKVPWEKT